MLFISIDTILGLFYWEALKSDQSMSHCRKLLEEYFTNVHKVKNPSSNSSVYMRSMKLLKDFIDKTYRSVTLYIESEFPRQISGVLIKKETETKRVHTQTATVDILPPSHKELKKYLNVWDNLEHYSLQESVLEKLFLRTYLRMMTLLTY
jgi:hypothetical protein